MPSLVRNRCLLLERTRGDGAIHDSRSTNKKATSDNPGKQNLVYNSVELSIRRSHINIWLCLRRTARLFKKINIWPKANEDVCSANELAHKIDLQDRTRLIYKTELLGTLGSFFAGRFSSRERKVTAPFEVVCR